MTGRSAVDYQRSLHARLEVGRLCITRSESLDGSTTTNNEQLKWNRLVACHHYFGFTPAWFFNSPQNSEANCFAPFAASPAFSPAYSITGENRTPTTLAPSLIPRTPLTATLAVLRIAVELATLSVIQRFNNCPRALPRKDIRTTIENWRMEKCQKERVFWSGHKLNGSERGMKSRKGIEECGWIVCTARCPKSQLLSLIPVWSVFHDIRV